MEIYSKRSSLGCPAPIFIAVWHILALLPGAIHSFFASLLRQSYERKQPHAADSAQSVSARDSTLSTLIRESSRIVFSQRPKPPARSLAIDANDENDEDEHAEPTGREREKKIASAIQGANLAWPVQMAWAIYYIAGTLVFTSIMAVTVPELVVWVLLGLGTAGCSKVLALFLCLSFEDTGLKRMNEIEVVTESISLSVSP